MYDDGVVPPSSSREERAARCTAGLAVLPKPAGDSRRWTAWFATRALALGLGLVAFALHRGNVFFDTNYYARWAHGALTGSRVPYRDFSWEYPPGALVALAAPAVVERLLPGGFFGQHIDVLYGAIWVCFMLAVDAAVLRFVLRREAGRPRPPATALWVYGPPLLGALSWSRYDLLPAAAAMLAVVAAGERRPSRSGALAGAGTVLKLWPALLAPIQRTRRATAVALCTTVAVGAATALGTRLATGSTGFGQVLTYQRRRGLQVESVVALPLLWLRRLRVPGYPTHYRFGAWEVAGGPAPVLALLIGGVSVAAIAVVAIAHWRLMRTGATAGQVALSAVTITLITIVTNKVLSPQYLLWLLAVLVAACLLDPESWRPVLPWVLGLLALTQVVFPWLYGDLLRRGWPGLLVLTARDLVLVALLARAFFRVLSELHGGRRGRSAEPRESHPAGAS